MVSVLIVDDHLLMRRAVREILENEIDLLVVGEAGTGNEAETMAAEIQPDVVLMDADMPDCSGFDATERVLECSPQSRVIIFTATHQDQLVFQAIQKGAIGYITKDIEPESLLHAIRCAARNDLCIPGAFASQVLAQIRLVCKLQNVYGPLSPPANLYSYRLPCRITQPVATLSNEQSIISTIPRPLTERERQILHLMRMGRKNREIAGELCIAESTVHKHVQNIFEKLQARNRTEAIYLTSIGISL